MNDGKTIQLLDHGYLKVIEGWGSDERVIEAARMSTDKGFLGWGTVEEPGDERLLKRLYTHHHTSPFEMAGLVIEVQAPIMVFREWQRHRTQSYNELSARYTQLPDLVYMPSIERIMGGKQSTTNKQGSEPGFTAAGAASVQDVLQKNYTHDRQTYEFLLSIGLARELARLPTSVAQYSRMRAQSQLLNWLKFLSLREDPGAQWEIRQYANALNTIMTERFPRTMVLYEEGKKEWQLFLEWKKLRASGACTCVSTTI